MRDYNPLDRAFYGESIERSNPTEPEPTLTKNFKRRLLYGISALATLSFLNFYIAGSMSAQGKSPKEIEKEVRESKNLVSYVLTKPFRFARESAYFVNSKLGTQ